MFRSGWVAHFEALDAREAARRAHMANVFHRASTSARFRALEDELARVRLLAFTLADICLATGLCTEDELKQRLEGLDASDGKRDFKLAPGRRLPGEPEPPPAPDPAARTAARRARLRRRGG